MSKKISRGIDILSKKSKKKNSESPIGVKFMTSQTQGGRSTTELRELVETKVI